MTINNRYLEKELSWLAFNERVLQQAADKSVPLLERVRFLGIYANNTDEFYKVRVAKIKRQLLHCRDQHHPQQSLLDQIQQRSLQAQHTFDVIYRALLMEMAQRGFVYLMNINSSHRSNNGSRTILGSISSLILRRYHCPIS